VRRVREIHNVSALDVGGETEVSLHLKLPGELTLEDAHEVAEQVERAIRQAVPEARAVQTHLEPLAEALSGAEIQRDRAAIARIVEETTGRPPRDLRFLTTDEGVVVYLTLALDPSTTLAQAHAEASRVEERIRATQPEIDDVIVHTEP
jgi:divalent metal cation (Fe/Co/Zn/Cd) transporter